MKAAVSAKYGLPDVIEVKDVPAPQPKDNELLIKVHATTVNRTDDGFLRGKPYIVRLFSGLRKPKATILGCEFAGEVVEVGKSVSMFKTGDRVFGFNDSRFGGHAQYMTMHETAAITTIPDGITYEVAAALTEGAHYALSDLRAAKVGKGQTVMIYGATGAIGSAAVQLARHLGAYVVAVCATPHLDLIKSIGADEVIDYTVQDFTQTHHRFDVVFDAVGKSTFGACKPILKPRGIYMSTELGPNWQNIYLPLFTAFGKGKKIIFPIPATRKEDMELFGRLATTGGFRPLIDRYYTLDQIQEAYYYVESGQKIGNVVITISHE